MKDNIEIKIKEGLNELKFGLTMAEVKKILGNPDDTEILDDSEEITELWYYFDDGITVFFEEYDEMRCVCLETDNSEAFLLGEKIADLKEKDIIDLFCKNGFNDFEKEDEDWGEKRISFNDAVADIYFENDELISINWGVDYDEDEDDKPLWP
jgi:hypothetical protein